MLQESLFHYLEMIRHFLHAYKWSERIGRTDELTLNVELIINWISDKQIKIKARKKCVQKWISFIIVNYYDSFFILYAYYYDEIKINN